MRTDDGMYLMPESYAVPADAVTAEYSNPGSQPREVVGRCPFLWGQSLYILGKLLQEVNIVFSNFTRNDKKIKITCLLGISCCWRIRSIESTFRSTEKTRCSCSSCKFQKINSEEMRVFNIFDTNH